MQKDDDCNHLGHHQRHMHDTQGLLTTPASTVPVPAYDPQSPVTPLTPEELQALDQLLQQLDGDQVMSLDGMDGYLTAIAIGPAALRSLPSTDWLPAIWGGDPLSPDEAAPFGSKRQRKNTVVLALRHLRHLDQQLHETAAAWEPIFSMAEQGDDEWADAREWCMGFLQAVDLLPLAWQTAQGPVWTTQPLAQVLRPLLLLGGGLETAALQARTDEDIDDLASCDAMSRAVPDAVLQLKAALRS